MFKSIHLVIAIVLINVAVSQAMLPPPMLRAVCGAFADAEEAMAAKTMMVGQAAVDLAMKPIAIVGGLKAAAVGTGMKVSGGAVKFIGEKMAKDGAILEATGAGVKGAGLGVAALAVKPFAEKVVTTGNTAQGTINAVHGAAQNLVKSVGDTSIQIDATIDSPIIGHHRKEVSVTGGMDYKESVHHQNQIEQQQQQQLEQQQQQATITKRAAKIDAEAMKAALNLVHEAKMESCVARAICDLNCNPQGFGQDGKQVFMNMVRLQGANAIESSDLKFFQESAAKGRANSGKCDQCSELYACKSKSSDLIKLASHIRMD